jgi:hypothetical protein
MALGEDINAPSLLTGNPALQPQTGGIVHTRKPHFPLKRVTYIACV